MKLVETYRSPVLHGYVIEVENLAEFPVLLSVQELTSLAWSLYPPATNIWNLVQEKPAKRSKKNSELAFTSRCANNEPIIRSDQPCLFWIS